MGRIYLKRIAVLCFLVTVLYVTIRSLSGNGAKARRSKWFFEYAEPTPSNGNGNNNNNNNNWQPAVDSVVLKKISINNAEDLKPQNPTVIPLLGNGAVPTESLLQSKKCPVCFGLDLCDHIRSGILEVDMSQMLLTPGKPKKMSYNGALHTSNAVVVKTLASAEFGLLDRLVCDVSGAAAGGADCEASVAGEKMAESGAVKKLLLVDEVQRMYRQLKKTKGDLPIAICTNDKLLTLLKKAFHESKEGEITDAEQIMLYSTLASNPELVVLKFLTKFFPSLPFPQYYGSCGRVYVVEGGITPLRDFLNEPFQVRASLGAHLLQMIDDFIADEDSEWFVMFTDFSFHNLGVNKDGEVVIIDVEDMILIDKAVLKEKSEATDKFQKNNSQLPCNENCLRLFTQQLLHSSDYGVSGIPGVPGGGESSCAGVSRYGGHLMYAVACQRILSYMDEHRVENFFNADPYKRSPPSPFKGLLHGTPSKDKGALDELLQECVQETAPGGRIQAAEELKDYLSEFFKDDDDDGGGEGEDDKNNNADEYEINGGGQKL